MNPLILIPPVTVGPITARTVLHLSRDPRAVSRSSDGLLSIVLNHRLHSHSVVSRRFLSSSSTLNHRVDKMSAEKNAWVGYQGAAGYDLRSEFATVKGS